MLFLGAFCTAKKSISWENTEMLLCTYCIGLMPKMLNGYGSGHLCRELGMILATLVFGSTSETFSLFCSFTFLLYICADQELKNENRRRPVRKMTPMSSVFWFSFMLLLYLFSFSLFPPLSGCFFSVRCQNKSDWFAKWQQIIRTLCSPEILK